MCVAVALSLTVYNPSQMGRPYSVKQGQRVHHAISSIDSNTRQGIFSVGCLNVETILSLFEPPCHPFVPNTGLCRPTVCTDLIKFCAIDYLKSECIFMPLVQTELSFCCEFAQKFTAVHTHDAILCKCRLHSVFCF